MSIPNPICSPPNPAARYAVPQAAGEESAAAPRSMKRAPIAGTGRTDIWRIGGRMVSAHPVRGVGSGNFALVSGHYLLQKPGYIRRDFFIREPKVAHNMYLHVLAKLGIMGLSLFTAMLGFTVVCAFKAAGRFASAGVRTASHCDDHSTELRAARWRIVSERR